MVWSSSASVSSTAAIGLSRPERGCSAGVASIWLRRSGEALSRNQVDRSALTAIDDWVRGRVGREPSRTARQPGHPQFHWGKPPPAPAPSTRTHIVSRPPPGHFLVILRTTHARGAENNSGAPRGDVGQSSS